MGCSLQNCSQYDQYVIYLRELTIDIQDVMLTLVKMVMHIRNQLRILEKHVSCVHQHHEREHLLSCILYSLNELKLHQHDLEDLNL